MPFPVSLVLFFRKFDDCCTSLCRRCLCRWLSVYARGAMNLALEDATNTTYNGVPLSSGKEQLERLGSASASVRPDDGVNPLDISYSSSSSSSIDTIVADDVEAEDDKEDCAANVSVNGEQANGPHERKEEIWRLFQEILKQGEKGEERMAFVAKAGEHLLDQVLAMPVDLCRRKEVRHKRVGELAQLRAKKRNRVGQV